MNIALIQNDSLLDIFVTKIYVGFLVKVSHKMNFWGGTLLVTDLTPSILFLQKFIDNMCDLCKQSLCMIIVQSFESFCIHTYIDTDVKPVTWNTFLDFNFSFFFLQNLMF